MKTKLLYVNQRIPVGSPFFLDRTGSVSLELAKPFVIELLLREGKQANRKVSEDTMLIEVLRPCLPRSNAIGMRRFGPCSATFFDIRRPPPPAFGFFVARRKPYLRKLRVR
jgi:hypothetical protein